MKMTLEMFDDVGKIVGRVREIQHDEVAEHQVVETARKQLDIIRWVLHDNAGKVRAIWNREDGSYHAPDMAERSSDYEGKWLRGPKEPQV